MSAVYQDTDWLPSLFRAIHDFVMDEIDKYFKTQDGFSIGLDAFDITFDFPAAVELPKKVPFQNDNGRYVTVIHFVIDDIDNQPLGIGESVIEEILSEDDLTLTPQEAHVHTVNFDVGVWATDASGGSTSRLVAYGMLSRIFGPPSARDWFQTKTNGLEIISFRGGRMIQETINDIRIYRVIDAELIVRAYSRNDVVDQPVAGEISQNTGLIIGDTIIVDVP